MPVLCKILQRTGMLDGGPKIALSGDDISDSAVVSSSTVDVETPAVQLVAEQAVRCSKPVSAVRAAYNRELFEAVAFLGMARSGGGWHNWLGDA